MTGVYGSKFVLLGPIVLYFLVNTIGRGDKLDQKGQDEFIHPGNRGLIDIISAHIKILYIS